MKCDKWTVGLWAMFGLPLVWGVAVTVLDVQRSLVSSPMVNPKPKP